MSYGPESAKGRHDKIPDGKRVPKEGTGKDDTMGSGRVIRKITEETPEEIGLWRSIREGGWRRHVIGYEPIGRRANWLPGWSPDGEVVNG